MSENYTRITLPTALVELDDGKAVAGLLTIKETEVMA
jgi:hypothetical protein